jgi:hypothetical protein
MPHLPFYFRLTAGQAWDVSAKPPVRRRGRGLQEGGFWDSIGKKVTKVQMLAANEGQRRGPWRSRGSVTN